jgi:hypothetical protein
MKRPAALELHYSIEPFVQSLCLAWSALVGKCRYRHQDIQGGGVSQGILAQMFAFVQQVLCLRVANSSQK